MVEQAFLQNKNFFVGTQHLLSLLRYHLDPISCLQSKAALGNLSFEEAVDQEVYIERPNQQV